MSYRIFVIFIAFFILILFNLNHAVPETGISGIPVFNYITGRFDPAKNKDFISLKKAGISVASDDQYLRCETAEAFLKLTKNFNHDHPKIKLTIISATRNYNSQKVIWDEKWSGKRKVQDVRDISKIANKIQKAKLILRYSSMPGTSRHHWGTDFDLNSLNNTYFEKGDGNILYKWMLNNASKYGFYQPYTQGRPDGYNEEKWHWSYIPLAKKYLEEWNACYKTSSSEFTKPDLFSGSADVGQLASVYVNSINNQCK